METIIREGALRLLLLNDASCDVILSCQGHRLMAHKLILSMASPVFRALLLENSSDSTVIIFPDTSANVMSMILDYIYTGSVVVYSNMLKDFLSLADLLKIYIDVDSDGLLLQTSKLQEDEKKLQKKEEPLEMIENDIRSKKNLRKLPNLLPLSRIRPEDRTKTRKKLFSYVLPSPWCSRIEKTFGDPTKKCSLEPDNQILSPMDVCRVIQNDTNNNLQIHNFSQHPLDSLPNDFHISYPFQSRLKELSRREQETSSVLEQLFKPRLENTERSVVVKDFARKEITCDFPPENEKAVNYPIISKLEFSKCLNLKRISPTISEKDKLTIPKNSLNSPNSSNTDNERSRDTTECSSPELTKSPRQRKFFGKASNPSNLEKEESCSKTEVVVDNLKDNSNHSVSAEEEKNENDDKEKAFDKNKPYKCEDCGKGFSQMRNYKYHRSIHEGTKEFAAKCPECGKTFNDKGYLSSHIKIHRDKKEYACPQCPKRFNQRVAYNMHLRIHTGIKPHECPTCGKSFSRKMLLKQHQRVHTGERPYSCPECGKTFADRSNMSLHARLHTGVKPYACNLCPKSFTKKHHLKTHMNFHTGLKPYTCQKCGLAFSQSSNMRTHYKKCVAKNPSAANNETPTDKKKNTTDF